MSQATRFIGVWSLERWTSDNGEPFGPDPQGTLVYTAQGTMISAFMRRGRAPLGGEAVGWRRYALGLESAVHVDADAMQRRFAEAAIAFNSYAGRYSIEGERVHHDVEIAMFPDWIGKRLTRSYRFEGDRLALSFESDALLWRRKELRP